MCTPGSSTLKPLWTYCRPGVNLHRLASLSMWSLVYAFTIHALVAECQFVYNTFKYNFQQRISWLSHRWRTQRNAISNVNCRIQWIIESLNAPCTLWYSKEYACLSVMEFSSLWYFCSKVLDLEAVLAQVNSSEIYECESLRITISVIICLRCGAEVFIMFMLRTVCMDNLDNLTSNQVGLPAELKHINKRRKRN